MPPAKKKESVTPILWEDIQDHPAAFVGAQEKSYFLKAINASRLDVHLRSDATRLVTCPAVAGDRQITQSTYERSKKLSTFMALWKGSSVDI